MLLKHYLDQGVSKAELSRRFGVSRRTIHHWITTGQLDRNLREVRNCKLTEVSSFELTLTQRSQSPPKALHQYRADS